MASAGVPELLHLLNNSFSLSTSLAQPLLELALLLKVSPSSQSWRECGSDSADSVQQVLISGKLSFNALPADSFSPCTAHFLLQFQSQQIFRAEFLSPNWDWEQEFCHWAAYTENPLICLVLVTVDISQSRLRLIVSWGKLRLAEKFSESIL